MRRNVYEWYDPFRCEGLPVGYYAIGHTDEHIFAWIPPRAEGERSFVTDLPSEPGNWLPYGYGQLKHFESMSAGFRLVREIAGEKIKDA